MGYVFDFKDAQAWELAAATGGQPIYSGLEEGLMLALLAPRPGETVLDIGCGIGSSLAPLLERGLVGSGLDASPYMLDIAANQLTHRVDLHRGRAESLPFDDNSFSYSLLVTTLEFVDDPELALAEALRVTKDRLFIGFLNRYAIKGLSLRVRSWLSGSIYRHARFFSLWELTTLIHKLAGDVPMKWRTVCQFSTARGGISRRIEGFPLVQRCPFGAFAGIVVSPNPRFRARPLTLKISSKHPAGSPVG